MAETTQPVLAAQPGSQTTAEVCVAEEGATAALALSPPKFIPRRYKPRNVGEWTGHLTFASELIVALQPDLIVELGTHWGEAYFTFCQTVQENGLNTLCYAVDHWLGDEHSGHYGEEVFEEVTRYNDRFYRQFSYLLRRSFDDALVQFADDSIGLLHIDGLHTYEAVKHDFENWLPKMKPGGVILLHDICPRHQDFGVWRLWDEIKAEFADSFEFHHSWGLGVVRKPGAASDAPLPRLLFASSPDLQEDLRRHYAIYASHLEHLLARVPPMAAPSVKAPPEIRVQVFPRIDGSFTQETSQIHKMEAGAWSTLVFDLRDPNIRGPLRIDPGSEPSFVEVGDILVHSTETGELIWSSRAGPQRDYHILGTAHSYRDDASFLINRGDDPQLLLNTSSEVRGPLRLTVSLKIIPIGPGAVEIIGSRLEPALAQVTEERDRLTSELADTRSQLDDTLRARDEAQAALERTRAEAQHTRQLLAEEQSRFRRIENSLSWRVTAPIRNFMTALRSGPRKESGS